MNSINTTRGSQGKSISDVAAYNRAQVYAAGEAHGLSREIFLDNRIHAP